MFLNLKISSLILTDLILQNHQTIMPHIRKYKRKKQSKIPTQSIVDKASCDIVLSFERHCVTLSGDGPSEPNA